MAACSRCPAPDCGTKKNGRPYLQCARCRARDKDRRPPRGPVRGRVCAGCGDELDPNMSMNAHYCSSKCRYEFRDDPCRVECAGGCGERIMLSVSSLPAGKAKCQDCRRRDADWPRVRTLGTCSKCDRPSQAKDLCASHYGKKWRKDHGKPYYSKYAWWIDPKKRYAIYNRDQWTCGLCGLPVDREWDFNSPNAPTLDHIVPRSQGGAHDPSNLTTAHAYCNAIRRDQDFTEFIIWRALDLTT